MCVEEREGGGPSASQDGQSNWGEHLKAASGAREVTVEVEVTVRHASTKKAGRVTSGADRRSVAPAANRLERRRGRRAGRAEPSHGEVGAVLVVVVVQAQEGTVVVVVRPRGWLVTILAHAADNRRRPGDERHHWRRRVGDDERESTVFVWRDQIGFMAAVWWWWWWW